MKLPAIKDQKGALPLLLIVAVVGILGFLAITQFLPFSDGLLSLLYQKAPSFAAEPGASFVDGSGNTITTSPSNTVKVKLNAPWPVQTADAGFSFPEMIETTSAQISGDQVIEMESVPFTNSSIQVFSDSNASGGSAVAFILNTSLSGPMTLRSNPTILTIRARGDQCFGAPKMAIYLDNNLVSSQDVNSTSWKDYTFTLNGNAGTHKIDFSYTNDRAVRFGNIVICDRNLRIDKVTISGSTQPAPTATAAPSMAPSSGPSSTPTPTPTPSAVPSLAPSAIPSPLPSVNPTPIAGIMGFAVIGDSASDEYRADDNRGGTYGATTLNWDEQLFRKGVNFGAWSNTSRGEPRRKGYEYNFARSGATVASLISAGQHTSVRDLIRNGKVSHVYIQIGANDAAESNGSYQDIYNGVISGSALQTKQDNLITGYTTILDTVKSGGNAKIVVATMPDINLDPGVVSRFTDPIKRKRVSDFIAGVNTRLKAAASQRGIPVFDTQAFFASSITSRLDSQNNVLVGGEKIDLKTVGDEPHHSILADRVHAGTVLNGLLANGIANIFNQNFGQSLPTFTDQEMLINAGIKAVPPTPTPTPTPKIASAVLAEDSNFTQNVVSINPVSSNPMIVDYTFSGGLGVKTLHIKYNSSTGEQKTFTATIEVVQPAPSPMPSASHDDHVGSGGNSYAMGMWTPNPKFDTCTVAQHDSYKVKGPDGKWYPTWHPPFGPGDCKFGHEHGRDPSGSMAWKQAKEYFYFDENKNGTMDPSEEAVSGLPFGYTNEQFDVYLASKGQSGMRHEDHVGHKVDWANDDNDIATHRTSTVLNGGVAIQKNDPRLDTGVRCYFLAKPHQGVSTKDAFMNNIHEIFYFQDCRYAANPALNSKVSLAMMEGFGAPGGFTSFAPMCGLNRRGNAQDLVCPLGKDASGKCVLDSVNQNYPTDNGAREIITRECIEIGFLVPEGQWSGNMYEAWPAQLEVVKPNGTKILGGISLLFDVEDANRYYWPGKPNNVGYTMELCYDQSLASQGRIYRGGSCMIATNYDRIKDITWDDPRSGFKGLHRGMYFQPGTIKNSGASSVWYTDPFGKNASETPFAGSVKQVVEAKNIDYSSLIGQPLDPRVNDRKHSSGNGTVHAPN